MLLCLGYLLEQCVETWQFKDFFESDLSNGENSP